MTDIHAGSADQSHSGAHIVYPNRYVENTAPVLNSGADLIVTLGDNIDDEHECQYADKLKQLFSNKNILWAKGNHDKACYKIFSNQNYYYQDLNGAGWRIVMLDDDIDIDNNELNWLKNEALKTDKSVLIVEHIPFFNLGEDEYGSTNEKTETVDRTEPYPQYVNVEQVIAQSGNVKLVFFGHFHDRIWEQVYDGVHYFILPSTSTTEYNGYYLRLKLGPSGSSSFF